VNTLEAIPAGIQEIKVMRWETLLLLMRRMRMLS
jgi:hypothetical protein